MSKTRSVLLLAVLWVPAVAMGLLIDRSDMSVNWMVRATCLIVYAVVITSAWWWVTNRHRDSGHTVTR